jgi:hypothetical protein
MGKLEELRELRRLAEEERRRKGEEEEDCRTLCEFLNRKEFAGGQERVPSDYVVESGVGGLTVTFREHMEGWRLVVEVQHPAEAPKALERALNDLSYPRVPFKSYKPLPKWWLEFQKKNGHKP